MALITTNSRGRHVAEWQEFLNSLGEDLVEDGINGPATIAATKRFQKLKGLKDDGIVGSATYFMAAKMGFIGAGISKPSPTMLISAGHSTVPPRDPGASGNGFTESYLALELRDKLADYLRDRGATVIEDGVDGENLPLKKAIALAKTVKIALEFHWNAGPAGATGIEVLCHADKKELAQKVAQSISKATGLKLRGEDGYKPANSGQHHRLGFCDAGGLVVEVCFISNPSDMLAYNSSKNRVVENIANALLTK